jgi:(S)-ureidoglycine aminohydrolase
MSNDRGRRGRGYTLITPANHYPSRLPEYADAPVVKLVTPRLAPSRIGEYLVAPRRGLLSRVDAGYETFFYGLEGEVRIDAVELGPGAYAYVPASTPYTVHARTEARFLVIKRRYEPVPHLPAPGPLHGHRDDQPFADTPVKGFRRRELLPVDDAAFDFAMSLLAFDPGVGLANIEIHDEEHGLYMTAGGGEYHLDGDLHDVVQGDFIYMAPYCPQGFTAGDRGGEYLLYKDTWRDGFAHR